MKTVNRRRDSLLFFLFLKEMLVVVVVALNNTKGLENVLEEIEFVSIAGTWPTHEKGGHLFFEKKKKNKVWIFRAKKKIDRSR